MNLQAKHYESTGDKNNGEPAIRAYRAAQNHLDSHSEDYINDAKRIQQKIVRELEQK